MRKDGTDTTILCGELAQIIYQQFSITAIGQTTKNAMVEVCQTGDVKSFKAYTDHRAAELVTERSGVIKLKELHREVMSLAITTLFPDDRMSRTIQSWKSGGTYTARIQTCIADEDHIRKRMRALAVTIPALALQA